METALLVVLGIVLLKPDILSGLGRAAPPPPPAGVNQMSPAALLQQNMAQTMYQAQNAAQRQGSSGGGINWGDFLSGLGNAIGGISKGLASAFGSGGDGAAQAPPQDSGLIDPYNDSSYQPVSSVYESGSSDDLIEV